MFFNRNLDELKKYQDLVMENGVAHILYHASDIHDIIHPCSIKGKELLTEDFLTFLEKYKVIIPDKVPVLLEITGKAFTEEEKMLIDNTIWEHFCINMTYTKIEAKAFMKRSALYFIYTIISAGLLFFVGNITDELLINLAYLPFWFFGYRLLIFLVIDSFPLWKIKNWYHQLASMHLLFSDEHPSTSHQLSGDEIAANVLGYRKEIGPEIKTHQMAVNAMRNRGLTELKCSVRSIEDLIKNPELKEREYLSGTLAGYIDQVEGFFRHDCKISLEIDGPAFTREEQKRIGNAIRNYYGFRIASGEKAIEYNRYQSLFFALAAFISGLIVILWGALADIASHEMILMLLWFFGDYFLEFILITRSELRKLRKTLENCRDMQLIFKHREI